ncbi:DUF2764 family protein [Candidatus Omnitrophota bacterium]
MSAHYTYLLSSLPMLHFGTKPPLSFDKFIRTCTGLIPQGELEMLKGLTHAGASLYKERQPTLKKWSAFEKTLRNELVKIRAQRKRVNPDKYLREEDYAEPHTSRVAMNALKNPSIIEGENYLDQERWRALDELSAGHYFDPDALIVYALKLLILQRWERVNTADKSGLLEEVLA